MAWETHLVREELGISLQAKVLLINCRRALLLSEKSRPPLLYVCLLDFFAGFAGFDSLYGFL